MNFPLRLYQHEGVKRTLELVDTKANPLLVAPTGAGKTVMGRALVRRSGRRVLWIAHRKELIEQAAEALQEFMPGIIMAGHQPIESNVQVASIQTLIRRDVPPVDLVIVDEAHHAMAGTYRKVLDRCRCPYVGLTATPFRLDGKGLGDLFSDIVVAARPADLCEAGTLHAPKVFAGDPPNLRGVKKTGGDYNVGALGERVNTTELVGDIVKTWQQRGQNKRTVCFAVNIAHSEAIVAAFQAEGVAAEHLDGKTNKDERADILARLRGGETRIVSNCMVLTEGWDLPKLEIAIVARPTASLNLHLQMLGRIMRAAPGKDGCVVLDHAGNVHRHGLVTRHIEYSLNGKVAGESEPLGLRRCRECGLLYDPKLDCCPECGWAPEVTETEEGEGVHAAGELTEFTEDYAYRKALWDTWEGQREFMGFREGWSAYQYKERFGEWPKLVGRELLNVDKATMDEKEKVYVELLERAAFLGFKEGWASFRYKEMFGVWPKGFVSQAKRDAISKRWRNNECGRY